MPSSAIISGTPPREPERPLVDDAQEVAPSDPVVPAKDAPSSNSLGTNVMSSLESSTAPSHPEADHPLGNDLHKDAITELAVEVPDDTGKPSAQEEDTNSLLDADGETDDETGTPAPPPVLVPTWRHESYTDELQDAVQDHDVPLSQPALPSAPQVSPPDHPSSSQPTPARRRGRVQSTSPATSRTSRTQLRASTVRCHSLFW